MQLTSTTWAQSIDARDEGRAKIYRPYTKHDSVSQHDLRFSGCHSLGVLLVTSLQPNLCTSPSTYSTTENNSVLSLSLSHTHTHTHTHTHAHTHTHTHTHTHSKRNCSSTQCMFNRIHRILVTSKWTVGFPSTDY
jgi:hypothetical protein